jgi:hypothetical protein
MMFCKGLEQILLNEEKIALEKISMDRFYRKNHNPVLRSKQDRD